MRQAVRMRIKLQTAHRTRFGITTAELKRGAGKIKIETEPVVFVINALDCEAAIRIAREEFPDLTPDRFTVTEAVAVREIPAGAMIVLGGPVTLDLARAGGTV
jgi:hypothetical protein